MFLFSGDCINIEKYYSTDGEIDGFCFNFVIYIYMEKSLRGWTEIILLCIYTYISTNFTL